VLTAREWHRGTANAPLLSHHVPTPGTLVQQYPEVTAQFSGEHTFQELLFPSTARRRRPGPKKPIISKKIWKAVNTPAVLAGEEFANLASSQGMSMEQAVQRQKMARQMYERNSVRFNMSERAWNREIMETRAGQKRLGASLAEGAGDFAQSIGQSLAQSSRSESQHSRAEVLPGDLLQSIERYSRNAGSLLHEKRSILPNGFLSRDGHREKLLPSFVINDGERKTRRVVTGGATDRLNYSDGSLMVLLPPKVVTANPALACKPLILRDGTQSTIRARTQPRADSSVASTGELTMEVQRLSMVHTAHTPYYEQTLSMSQDSGADIFNQKSSASLLSSLSGHTMSQSNLFTPQNSKEFITSLSPRSWEKLTESKRKMREKANNLNLRPDLDALAEVCACMCVCVCVYMGRAASGGALAPEPPRATRKQLRPMRIFLPKT